MNVQTLTCRGSPLSDIPDIFTGRRTVGRSATSSRRRWAWAAARSWRPPRRWSSMARLSWWRPRHGCGSRSILALGWISTLSGLEPFELQQVVDHHEDVRGMVDNFKGLALVKQQDGSPELVHGKESSRQGSNGTKTLYQWLHDKQETKKPAWLLALADCASP